MSQNTKEYQREYYRKNRAKILARQNQYNESKREEQRQYSKDYYDNNKFSVLKRQNEYQKLNRAEATEYHNNYVKKRTTTDPIFRLRRNVSSTIYLTLKSNGSSKRGESVMKYLSYTIEELRKHLESQFEPWMNWDNWGVYNTSTYDDQDSSTWRWNIDHIVPQSKLPYTSMMDENFQKCWALKNLRPMLSKANLEKGDK
jgi:hypothetical protein